MCWPTSSSACSPSIPILIGLTIIVFLMLALIPGGTAVAILGPLASTESVAKLNAELGLDQPLIQQYLTWMGNLLHGDMGRSYSLKRPVVDEVFERFSATVDPRRHVAGPLLDLRPARRHRLGRPPVRMGRPHHHLRRPDRHLDPVVLAGAAAHHAVRGRIGRSSRRAACTSPMAAAASSTSSTISSCRR